MRSLQHVRLTMRETRHRVLGVNAIPHEAWLDSAADAAAMVGKRRELAQFRTLLGTVADRQPELQAWLARKPLVALELGPDWRGLLDIVQWLRENPLPDIYVRQMNVTGVDTKFVDKHRAVLAELLDIALSPEAINQSVTRAAGFASRYGFKRKPDRIRLRILDPQCALLPWQDDEDGQDLTLGVASFSALRDCARRAIITENAINFLALPPMPGTIAIFGAGYGFEALRQAKWLSRCNLHYWGDIDTHGFAILDELRHHFPNSKSLLMDHRTLFAFKPLWVSERIPTDRDLSQLTQQERDLYDDLRKNKYGASLRLEQERIGFEWVKDALAGLPDLD